MTEYYVPGFHRPARASDRKPGAAVAALRLYGAKYGRPVIVCLCGSTRFYTAFQRANFERTLAGEIVLSVGCDTKSDAGLKLTEADKVALDQLHLRKIDLADYVLVLNVGRYVGESTRREIAYAEGAGKPVIYLEPWCCEWHHPVHCCDPEDCGPCCPECPTCPVLAKGRDGR